jgi:hypothetical protein
VNKPLGRPTAFGLWDLDEQDQRSLSVRHGSVMGRSMEDRSSVGTRRCATRIWRRGEGQDQGGRRVRVIWIFVLNRRQRPRCRRAHFDLRPALCARIRTVGRGWKRSDLTRGETAGFGPDRRECFVRVCGCLDGPMGDGIREAERAEVAKGIVGHYAQRPVMHSGASAAPKTGLQQYRALHINLAIMSAELAHLQGIVGLTLRSMANALRAIRRLRPGGNRSRCWPLETRRACRCAVVAATTDAEIMCSNPLPRTAQRPVFDVLSSCAQSLLFITGHCA